MLFQKGFTKVKFSYTKKICYDNRLIRKQINNVYAATTLIGIGQKLANSLFAWVRYDACNISKIFNIGLKIFNNLRFHLNLISGSFYSKLLLF